MARAPVSTLTLVVLVLAAGLSTSLARADVASPSRCPAILRHATDLGRLAFIDDGRLELLTLANCNLRTLVAVGVTPPVRWSGDGEYLGFGDGAVVPVGGGVVSHPLGTLAAAVAEAAPSWSWAPSGHTLFGVTRDGGVSEAAPGATPRRLLPPGWGATSLAVSANGRTLAAGRSLTAHGRAPTEQEVWLIPLPSGRHRELFHAAQGTVAAPWVHGFSPDGHWLLAWEDSLDSASLAADGLPLLALSTESPRTETVGEGTLTADGALGWCGDTLVYVLDRGGREVTLADTLALAEPPLWRPHALQSPRTPGRLSFLAPACTDSGSELAVAAGPAGNDDPLGSEQRRIWLLEKPTHWSALTTAPAAEVSDELPLWSSDGHWLAFVKTTWMSRRERATGELYLLELGASGTLRGPLASLGTTYNEFGTYGWDDQLAWRTP